MYVLSKYSTQSPLAISYVLLSGIYTYSFCSMSKGEHSLSSYVQKPTVLPVPNTHRL